MTWYRENRYVAVGLLGVVFLVIALGAQFEHVGTGYDHGFLCGIAVTLMLVRWVLQDEWKARKRAEADRDICAWWTRVAEQATFPVTVMHGTACSDYPRGDA